MSHDEEEYLLREERAGMEDLMQSREQDINDLNEEIEELKAEIEYLKTRLDKIYRDKSKKICPFMSQTVVAKCRKDCMAYCDSLNFHCAIVAGHYATAQEWSYKE